MRSVSIRGAFMGPQNEKDREHSGGNYDKFGLFSTHSQLTPDLESPVVASSIRGFRLSGGWGGLLSHLGH